MSCYDSNLTNVADSSNWLKNVQKLLFKKWSSSTHHKAGASHGTWACEIYHGCSTCNEHLSLPCSLLEEANEIAVLLESDSLTKYPSTYFRLYLLILSEFVAQLEQSASLIKLKVSKKPRHVSLWANRWAKHKLQILLQHHPVMLFADAFDCSDSELRKELSNKPMIDKCGNEMKLRIIDNDWLESNHGIRLNNDANGPGRAVILVPQLMSFLDETIEYYRSFVDACLKVPEKIREYESSCYSSECQ